MGARLPACDTVSEALRHHCSGRTGEYQRREPRSAKPDQLTPVHLRPQLVHRISPVCVRRASYPIAPSARSIVMNKVTAITAKTSSSEVRASAPIRDER